MDPSDNDGNLSHIVEAVAMNDGPAPDNSTGQKDTSPADMLRFSLHICFNTSILMFHPHYLSL